MEIYSYIRKAQFTGKIENHIGIKENSYFRPIVNNHIMYGIKHTNVEFYSLSTFKGILIDSRNGNKIEIK